MKIESGKVSGVGGLVGIIKETLTEDGEEGGVRGDVSDTDMGISNVPHHTPYSPSPAVYILPKDNDFSIDFMEE